MAPLISGGKRAVELTPRSTLEFASFSTSVASNGGSWLPTSQTGDGNAGSNG